MNQLFIVCILQSISNLLDVGDNKSERYWGSSWMALTQRAIGSIVHNDKRRVASYSKVQDAHNMGMYQLRQVARLGTELPLVLFSQLSIHDFDGGQSIKVNMLA